MEANIESSTLTLQAYTMLLGMCCGSAHSVFRELATKDGPEIHRLTLTAKALGLEIQSGHVGTVTADLQARIAALDRDVWDMQETLTIHLANAMRAAELAGTAPEDGIALAFSKMTM